MYYFDEFDGLSLTSLSLDAGGQAAGDYLPLAAGQFDAGGDEPTYHRGMSLSALLFLYDSTPAGMVTKARALQAKIGRRGKLYRQWRDGQREWVQARLITVSGKATSENNMHQEVQAGWQIESPVWYGETVNTEQENITTAPQNVTLNNAGNARVRNPVITVTGTATPITNLTIAISGASEFQWAGSLGSGNELVIDCGARSVLLDGADDYDAFSLTANHVIGDWLRLEPGNNTVVVTIAPGGALPATVEFEYYDAWR